MYTVVEEASSLIYKRLECRSDHTQRKCQIFFEFCRLQESERMTWESIYPQLRKHVITLWLRVYTVLVYTMHSMRSPCPLWRDRTNIMIVRAKFRWLLAPRTPLDGYPSMHQFRMSVSNSLVDNRQQSAAKRVVCAVWLVQWTLTETLVKNFSCLVMSNTMWSIHVMWSFLANCNTSIAIWYNHLLHMHFNMRISID